MCLLLGLTPRHCRYRCHCPHYHPCWLHPSSPFVLSILVVVPFPLTIPSPLSGPCLHLPLAFVLCFCPCLFVFHSQPCTFAPNINIPPFDIRHSIFSLPAKRIVLSAHPSRSSSSRPLMTPKNTNISPFHFSSLYHSDSDSDSATTHLASYLFSSLFPGRLCTITLLAFSYLA